MSTQKVELENSMIRDWPRASFYYIAPTRTCGCGNKAKYLVDGEDHCQTCALDAMDSEVYVRVRKI